MTVTVQLKLMMNDDLTLRDVVCQTLRQAIMEGTLLPGERLMEIPIAKQLGVSRTPVREAVRKLEQEGLVRILPRRGAVVAGITLQDLNDVLEVRSALEELAVRKACRRMTEEELKTLEQAGERFKAGLKKRDAGDAVTASAAIARADEAFHEVILGAAGNRQLRQLMEDIRSRMYRCRLEHIKNRDSHPVLIRQHDRIIQALRSRDEEAAASVIKEHIAGQLETVRRSLKNAGGKD